jgi:hypothetical protein
MGSVGAIGVTRRRRRLLAWCGACALGTAVTFVLSDRPGQLYLNPWYVDAIVSGAGVFLVVEAVPQATEEGRRGGFIRAGIGTAIVTLHLFQFLFDVARRL